jgi:rod shape-determining protein MreD
MTTLIAIPVLGALVILQTSLISRMPLLQGTPDLVLLAIIAWALQKRVQTVWQWTIIGGLMVTFVSALPPGVPLLGYGLTTALAIVLRKRVWQIPILAMFTLTFLGTFLTQGIAYTALQIVGSQITILEALNLVTLPSTLLNLILSVPAFALIGDLARWLYPEEIEA